jgi:hypothetical protein
MLGYGRLATLRHAPQQIASERDEKMTKSKYIQALESAWHDMGEWIKDGRFRPENEEDLQCFLYYGIVSYLKTAQGVRPKPTSDKPASIFSRGKKGTKDMHFPDFILGNPKKVVVEIKFARSSASILASCKKDIAKMKKYHSNRGVTKVFVLVDSNPDFVCMTQSQRDSLKAIDPKCQLMYFPETLSTKTTKDVADKAVVSRRMNIEIAREKRSLAAKKAHQARKESPEHKSQLILMDGNSALTPEGMERIYGALTGKTLSPEERKSVQERLDIFHSKQAGANADKLNNK